MSEININCYEFDDYRLDIGNYRLLINDEQISLTQKSFELLQYLVENRGRILKKEELLDALWEGNFVEEANLTQHIYMLRKALKQQDRKKVYIETIPKNGYRFLADVREVSETDIQITNNGHLAKDYLTTDFVNNTIPNDSLHNSHEENGKYQVPIINKIEDSSNKRIFPKTNLIIISFVGLLTISAFTYYYFFQTKNVNGSALKTKSLAVLPFKQIDGEKDEKLGVGVADVLIARLANIESITVSPTTSILRFANENNSNLAEVGEKLNVDYVIAGSIQTDNQTVRVTTQLYSVIEKKQVWTETFDEKYSDIFTLQDKISEKVALKVAMGLDGNNSALPYRQYTNDIQAYQAYSMGLSYWSMHSRPGFENAIRQFKIAIEKDPHFILAYAYLADSYGHTGHLEHLMTPEEARRKGEEAAEDALELDPKCAEAMSALALIYASRNKQTEAFELMQKSVQLIPNDAHARHRISWMYANKGDIEKAVSEMRIAQKLDPQSTYINVFFGEMLYFAGLYDESILSFKKSLEIEPNSVEAKWWLAKVFEQKKQYDVAIEELDKLGAKNLNNSSLILAKSRILAKKGEIENAKKLLNEVISKEYDKSLNYLIVQVQIALGEEEKAIDSLEQIVASIQDNIYTIKYEPNFKPIEKNERFIKILKEKEIDQGWGQS